MLTYFCFNKYRGTNLIIPFCLPGDRGATHAAAAACASVSMGAGAGAGSSGKHRKLGNTIKMSLRRKKPVSKPTFSNPSEV